MMKLVSVTVLGIMLLLLSLDFSERFIDVSQSTNVRDNSLSNVSVEFSPQLSKQTVLQLEALFNTYQSNEEPVASEGNSGLSAELQAQQRGPLTEFFSGDVVYKVVGVVLLDEQTATRKSFAVLRAENVRLKEVKLIELSDGAQLDGYKVEINNTTQIDFFHLNDNRKVELKLYQST
ncbi:hypothetical protein CWB96_10920 [Pseudoalteromonas citrea]|uniref:Uncharacterized protein n=1 Tax=Pseudoalteromonas citrea TaxID=43655 RepID=A0A5S3XPF3_9GAMM|nr:hypothetical protein [Pseudoalteromonas citrea]TMP45688.1 hypothetical protein CWB97_03565 [Pseudoalteromonas citrea]TMP59067.1 hypothetical protein CWB96_10920 [Pseudoalteromonas citrea]